MQAKVDEDKAEKKRIIQERINAGLEDAPVVPLSADLVMALKEVRLLHIELLKIHIAITSKKLD